MRTVQKIIHALLGWKGNTVKECKSSIHNAQPIPGRSDNSGSEELSVFEIIMAALLKPDDHGRIPTASYLAEYQNLGIDFTEGGGDRLLFKLKNGEVVET